MMEIAPRTQLIDLEHLGRARIIASCLLTGSGSGSVLIDPGPASTRATLERKMEALGLPASKLDGIVLTHIHLDHAGATGSLVREYPHLRVWVHERGAPHLADPTKLIRSARRLYGDELETLWGEIVPVPEDRIHILSGGETISVGDRALEVAYTPGHASHHVSFRDETTGLAFVGDTAGVRVLNASYVEPPTPPPDISLELWKESLAAIRAWNPRGLFLTHFGVAQPVADHLDELWRRLQSWSEEIRKMIELDGTDEERARQFGARTLRELRDQLPHDLAECYVQGGPPAQSFHGLARYWRKRQERQATA